MGTSCKGHCKFLENVRHTMSGFGSAQKVYDTEYGVKERTKRCTTCEYFIFTDMIACPCCKKTYRIKAKSQHKEYNYARY